jgi:hypothetical protein
MPSSSHLVRLTLKKSKFVRKGRIMKRSRVLTVLVVGLCVVVLLAACGSSSSGNSGTSTSGPPTLQPTVAKSKPSALPKVTVAFCQNIMTVDQSNTIMNPTTPATTIRVDSPASGGGSCNYEYALFKGNVSVVFVAVVPAGTDSNYLATRAAAGKQPGEQLTITPVSGVGDQAVFVVGSTTVAGQAYKIDALDIIYGSVFWDVNAIHLGAAAAATSDSAQLADFTQVAQIFTGKF